MGRDLELATQDKAAQRAVAHFARRFANAFNLFAEDADQIMAKAIELAKDGDVKMLIALLQLGVKVSPPRESGDSALGRLREKWTYERSANLLTAPESPTIEADFRELDEDEDE